jgi:probable O-glycosylation ligase (exosortase A-associated)
MAVVFWLKSRRKIQVGVLIAFAALVLVPLMPAEWYERMASIRNYEQDNSALGRINAWWMAFNLASRRFTGGGFEAFREWTFSVYAPDPSFVADAHSIYFEVLGEHGFPGLAIFLALAGLTWLSASAVIRSTWREPELKWLADLMRMTQVSLIAYWATGAFLGMAYFDYYYNLVLLVVITKVIVARHTAERSTAAIGGGTAPSPGRQGTAMPLAPTSPGIRADGPPHFRR